MELIVRDHDLAKLEEHIALLRRLAAEVGEREPRASVDVSEEEQYRNMGEVIDRHPEVIEAAEEAVRRIGVEPVRAIIRGGTDGARLSHRGLPTPNLFTGGSEYHSPRVGERAGHGRGGRDDRGARPRLGRAAAFQREQTSSYDLRRCRSCGRRAC